MLPSLYVNPSLIFCCQSQPSGTEKANATVIANRHSKDRIKEIFYDVVAGGIQYRGKAIFESLRILVK